jgi:microcystin-dependent protein
MLTSLMPRPAEVIFASGANSGEVKDFPNLARGWGLTFDSVDAGGNGGFPPMEWFNFLLERIDTATQYYLQRGAAEWASTTLYAPGSVVSNGAFVFRALRSNQGVQPSTDPTTWSQLADAQTATVLAPPGLFGLFSTGTVPAGWLKCNGASLSRTTYAALFGAIGTTFGSASSSTFNVPDVRGEFPRFWDDGRGVDAGRGVGTFQAAMLGAHAHGGSAVWVGDHAHGASAWTDAQGFHGHYVNDPGHGHGVYDPGHAHAMQKNASAQAGSDNGGMPTGVDTPYYSSNRWPLPTYASGTGIGIYGSGTGIWLNGDGLHGHNVGVSIGGAGGHAHAIATDTQGGAENRPRNFAVMACIKF